MRWVIILLLSISLSARSADHCRIVPFIKRWEAGLAHLPEGTTNKGIIYETTWIYYFGKTYDRFLAMSDEDWGYIYKKGYWDKIKGDSIQSQEVAEILADWVWMSGTVTPTKKVQKVLGIPQTGRFDSFTLARVNKANGDWLWQEIAKERFKFIANLGIYQPTKFAQFVNGWLNRMTNMIYEQYKLRGCK